MPRTNSNYPPSMKNLKKAVRDKTIEIANALKDKGYSDQRAIAIATDRAKQWYKGRNSSEKITHSKRTNSIPKVKDVKINTCLDRRNSI